jgi:hypothetical protein
MAESRCTAFQGTSRIASGPITEVTTKVKAVIDKGKPSTILIFDDATAEPVEIDFRGSVQDVIAGLTARSDGMRLENPQNKPRRPGRPKLGVVAREVTLLPRHWDWLARQPGGTSVALRKLVEEARRANSGKDRRREAEAGAYRFMAAMAGNEPGFEEAARALFAGDHAQFAKIIAQWPRDIADYAEKLAAPVFAERLSEVPSHPRR